MTLRAQPAPGLGLVESVNVGSAKEVAFRGRSIRTAIWKSPVAGRVILRGVNLEGDDQADRTVHGGVDKAVYAYAEEDLAWWSKQLARPLPAGTFGENLTTSGIDLTGAVIGERWVVGSAVLQVTQPRIPCYKLGIRMGDRRFPARFATAGRPGAYLQILSEGEIGAGDVIRVVSRPEHMITVGTVERAYHADRALAGKLLDAPELPEAWIEWARHVLDAMPARGAASTA